MTFQNLELERRGAATVLSLKNPGRKNAIGPRMVNELLHALEAAHGDDAVRVIVLTGHGDAFCAGGDFQQMTGGAAADELTPKGDYADLLLAMSRATKPVVARVNGHALGGGLGLVAASHLAVAARGAKLGTPEIDVGLFPMMIMAVLERVVPKRRLLEMMLLGEKVDADEAARIGLVSRAVDAAELDATVDALVERLAGKSPAALRLGLEAYAAQADQDLATALPMLRGKLAECLATDDAREGLMAFLEKRKPHFTGK
ncbi:MAG TPA: enoyl-CoA hydratase-related protein [Minicystis sp.]|nr:enoyl-CoA hydratase-related protein [Minicystis sp.]